MNPAITGESLPVEKLAGAHLFAGSINQSGAIEVRAERIGRDTSYGKIIEAVERAERSRAPVQRLADRLAGYLVYFALAAAVLTFLITHDIVSTISVIIVAGACGIAAGTPLAILGGIGRSARLGAIVKGGVHLETLGRVDTVVLDKTGTLTYGRPEVQRALPAAGITDEALLKMRGDGRAAIRAPAGQGDRRLRPRDMAATIIEPTTFSYTPGRGISTNVAGALLLGRQSGVDDGQWYQDVVRASAQANDTGSEVFVARDGHLLGSIIVADTVRPEAEAAVEALHRMGIRTVSADRGHKARRDRRGVEPRHQRDRSGTVAGAEADPHPGVGHAEARRRDGRRRRQRRAGTGRGQRGRCDGLRHRRGAGKRGRRAARQRSRAVSSKRSGWPGERGASSGRTSPVRSASTRSASCWPPSGF